MTKDNSLIRFDKNKLFTILEYEFKNEKNPIVKNVSNTVIFLLLNIFVNKLIQEKRNKWNSNKATNGNIASFEIVIPKDRRIKKIETPGKITKHE